jgi:hypothetical protein
LEKSVADLKFLDDVEGRLLACSQLGTAKVELPHQPGLEMKEAYNDLNNRIAGAAEQALRLHGPRVAGSLNLTIGPWVQTAECPPLSVFHRRPIGVKNVPLV